MNEKKEKKQIKAIDPIIIIIGIVIALAICLIAAIVGIAASIGSKDSTDEKETKPNSSAQVETNDQGDVAKTDKDGNFTVAGIAEKCIDSCVGITVYTEASNFSNFYSYGFDRNNSAQSGEEVKSGEGSGIFMLEDNGRTYILTCAHVISNGTRFTVTTNDGKEVLCRRMGVMQPDSFCKKFRYDPLKRKPQTVKIQSNFKEEDFSL